MPAKPATSETAVPAPPAQPARPPKTDPAPAPKAVPEVGGRQGPDPTRYGDWEKNGRCVDF